MVTLTPKQVAELKRKAEEMFPTIVPNAFWSYIDDEDEEFEPDCSLLGDLSVR